MKNPMDRQLEKRLSQRAVEIGREGEVEAFAELLELLQSSSANVCRLAASALGKLAWLGADQAAAVAALAPVMRRDPHAQTRQYAIKALKAYGAAAQDCLHDLRDIAANAAGKDYLRRDAEAAVSFIEEAVQIAADATRHCCQRCHVAVTAAERARSHQAFQRTFCDRCFDETFLARRNFETTVELSKTVEANDGTVVQSKGERQIAEWLAAHGLTHRYDAKFRIIGEFQIRPDFYLPELDVYVEYWGMDTPQYKMSMYKKQTLYQQEGKRLVSVYPKDLPSLDTLLSTKLRAFGYHPQPFTSAAKSGACITIAPDLQLRSLAPEDAAELFALVDANRAYLREWLPWLDRNTTVENSLAFIHSCMENAEKGIPVFAIELEGRIVGICGYNAVDRANREGKIGYWLDEGAGGRGVMTRACRAVIDHGFDALGLNRISIYAATGNNRSHAVAERLGFVLEGTLREAEWLYDHYVDWRVYSMLRREWSNRNRATTGCYISGSPNLTLSGVRKAKERAHMTQRLSGRERTLRALDFEPTDRVPVVGGFVRHPPFLAAAAGTTVEAFWADPKAVAIRAFRDLGVDCIIGLILPSPQSASGAQVDIHKPSRFDSPEAMLDEIAGLPAPADLQRAFDFRREYDAYLALYREGQAAVGDDILWIPNTFHCVAQFQNEGYFGAENYYMALALYPEAMDRFFAVSGERAFLRNTAVAKAMVDHGLPRVMWLGQDACDNRGPYIAPETMNEIYIRHVTHALAPLKDVGVKIIWHADGNIMPIVPYLLDAGVDGFQGLQETIETKIDVAALRELKTREGRPPVIVGSVSSVTTMPFGTPDDVRADVRRCQALAGAKGGGWLLNFSSSLGPEVPEASIRAFFAESTHAGAANR